MFSKILSLDVTRPYNLFLSKDIRNFWLLSGNLVQKSKKILTSVLISNIKCCLMEVFLAFYASITQHLKLIINTEVNIF